MDSSLDNICRTCLTSGGHLVSLFEGKFTNASSVAQMVIEISSVELSSSDNLPNKICLSCVAEVNRAYSFRIKCQNSDITLKQIFSPINLLQSSIEITNDVLENQQRDFQEEHIISSCNSKANNDLFQTEEEQQNTFIIADENLQCISATDILKNISGKKRKKSNGHSLVYLNEEQEILPEIPSKNQKNDDDLNNTVGIMKQEKELLGDEMNNERFTQNVTESNTIYEDSNIQQITDDYQEEEEEEEEGEKEEEEEKAEQEDVEEEDNQKEENQQNNDDNDQDRNDECYTQEIGEIVNEGDHENQSSIIYSCTSCNLNFDSEDKFQEHIQSCLIKGNLKEVSSKSKTRSKSKKEKKPIKCPYCPVDFIHPKNLEKHVKKYHEKDIKKEDEEMRQSTIEEKNKDDENETKLYSESKCTVEEIDIIDVKHNQEILNTPFKCYNCGAGFIKEKSLSYHLKLNKCTEKQFGCVSCKKVFIEKKSLLMHMKTHTTFACSKCPKTYSRQDKLKAHVDVAHSNVKRNQCHFCSKVFTMQSSLKDHIRTHSGEKPFLCSLCGKSFSQNTNLKQHMMRHTQTKPFQCNHCDCSFVSKGELNSHIRKHTGDHPFVCDICGTAFTTSSSLVKHKRRHTGERPYACEYCPMRFASLGVLKNHRRTHTGEKPFICNYCVKSFAQKSDCVTHMRTHTGEKPYVCSVCGIGFQQSSTLKTHLKSIHNVIYSKGEKKQQQQNQQQKQKYQNQQQEEIDDSETDILSIA